MTDRYWICLECGNKYGKARDNISTYHVEKCDYCGKVKAVTESRDFGYPKKEGE